MRQRIPWRRRKFLVHPIQRKYFFLSLVPLIVCAFLLILLVFLPLKLALAGLMGGAGPAPHPGQTYALAVRIWPAFLLSMVVSCLLSFFVTHKFAGPLYRFEQLFRRAADGELPAAFQLRHRDDLHEFAGHVNRAFGTLTQALQALRAHEGEAGRELAALRDRLQAGLVDAKEILAGLEAIGRRHTEIATILATFSFPSPPNGAGPAEEAAPRRQPPAAL